MVMGLKVTITDRNDSDGPDGGGGGGGAGGGGGGGVVGPAAEGPPAELECHRHGTHSAGDAAECFRA